LGDKIEEGYTGKTPGMYGEEEKCIQSFSGDTRMKETNWKT